MTTREELNEVRDRILRNTKEAGAAERKIARLKEEKLALYDRLFYLQDKLTREPKSET